MNILVSACLLGVECRYNGYGVLQEDIVKLMNKHTLIPVCPEQLGGLPTPRKPVELTDGRAVTKEGLDVTEEFQKGAIETLKLARLYRCDAAILKSNSPSCGSAKIYDGTFQGVLIEGNGLTAALLKENGIKVYTEHELKELVGLK
ncbi:hypothetical protein acsn021_37730 [Anaerocolumna cellulosilytica]|uniref:Uncharacterized protein n=1 Tax=Anaerocolumna cellulosilytica TaxID=433286 RepID=A0A6S6QZV9_9FIRM|nr:DUF523 domain-containing protein [Anaerocolumna cellulosilytica]MBB5194961.1 uncharacterized protein YbbK (DUF523 family) [Anaerocolumna cellulosilytica]BCJ96204.1 hypothetical protein acsn021_37730 [Anaerocolumna cellulosilytica]